MKKTIVEELFKDESSDCGEIKIIINPIICSDRNNST